MNGPVSENVQKRIAEAERSVIVSRVIPDDAHPEHQGLQCGRQHCSRPATYFVVRASTENRVSSCSGCLDSLLDTLLLAPVEEYQEDEKRAFERARREARANAHSGCTGHSYVDADGICTRAVVTDGLCANHLGAKKAAQTRRATPRQRQSMMIERKRETAEQRRYRDVMRQAAETP